jgi:hypothetical protein
MHAILNKALHLEEQSAAKHEAALAGAQLRNSAELETVRNAAHAALRIARDTEQELRNACSAAQSELHREQAARVEMEAAVNTMRSELAEAQALAQRQQEEERAPPPATASAIAANAAWKTVAEKQNRALRRLGRELADTKRAQTAAAADPARAAGAAERLATLEARVATSEAAELHARSVSERAVAALKKVALERRTNGSGDTPRTIVADPEHARILRELGDELRGTSRGVDAVAGVLGEHAQLIRDASVVWPKDGSPPRAVAESAAVADDLVRMLRAQSRVAAALHARLSETRDGELAAALTRARNAEQRSTALSNRHVAVERDHELERSSLAARARAAERDAAAQQTHRTELEQRARTAQNDSASATTRAASLQRELAAAAAAHAASEKAWRLREEQFASLASRATDAAQLRALAELEESDKAHTDALCALRADHAAALAEQREAHVEALRASCARRAQQQAEGADAAATLALAERALGEVKEETAAALAVAGTLRERADERAHAGEAAASAARAAMAAQAQQLATARAQLAQLLAAAVTARQHDLQAAAGAASRVAAAAAHSAHGRAIDAAAAAETSAAASRTLFSTAAYAVKPNDCAHGGIVRNAPPAARRAHGGGVQDVTTPDQPPRQRARGASWWQHGWDDDVARALDVDVAPAAALAMRASTSFTGDDGSDGDARSSAYRMSKMSSSPGSDASLIAAAAATDAAGAREARGIWRETDVPERNRATVGTPIRIWTTTMTNAVAAQIARRPSPRGMRPLATPPPRAQSRRTTGRAAFGVACARSAPPRAGGAPLDAWSQLARDGRGGPFSRAAAAVSPY